MSAEGRLLGIDPGTKRIGYALSDDMRWTARPLEVWTRKSLEEDLAHLRSLIEAHEVTGIVCGVPYSLEGRATRSTERAKAFLEAVRGAFPGMEIRERDEALTTWEAEQRMRELGLEPKKGLIDAYAAAVILKEALESPD